MLFSMGRVVTGFAAVILAAQTASAAEIKVFSTVGVKSVMEELVPKFEKASGHKLAITWSTAALLAKRVQAGEQADALILIKGNIETLLKAGKVMPGMTKAQVLMSLGYPWIDKTPLLESRAWAFRATDDDDAEYNVIWGSDDRVQSVEGSSKVTRLVMP